MSSIAIITARGGSKRIPKKNIKEFCGKPIITYSIEAAVNAGIFDEVMVSTDSDEIAEIARQYGARVPFMRSEKTSDDFATTSDVLSEVIEAYQTLGKRYAIGCCIYPTAPFINAKKLKDAFDIFSTSPAKTLLPVTAFSFPPQRGVYIRNDRLELVDPRYLNVRSQDIEKIYHDCGQFSFFKVDSFMKDKRLITDDTIPFIIDEKEVQDIDTESDWEIAEIKYRLIYDMR